MLHNFLLLVLAALPAFVAGMSDLAPPKGNGAAVRRRIGVMAAVNKISKAPAAKVAVRDASPTDKDSAAAGQKGITTESPTQVVSLAPGETITATTIVMPTDTNRPNEVPLNITGVDEGRWRFELEYSEGCEVALNSRSIHYKAQVGVDAFVRPDGIAFGQGLRWHDIVHNIATINFPQFKFSIGPQRDENPGTAYLFSNWGNGCAWQFGEFDSKTSDCGGCILIKDSVGPGGQPGYGPMHCPPRSRVSPFPQQSGVI
ncbi:hypothetical protein CC80DRAFT_489189 [Byssothecium circinans]|uniref:Uncharacterized protein n=1 Tax=Byssothecium circinans TaxID=147558 RepID=A0A6A5U8C8_9PLEO|nr:hypothetical protein CC80DRAFT_489189 [Byssothecium circinans]